MSTPFATASLYVGDLRSDVTESQLFDIFKNVGTVASIRVCRDAISRHSLGYAYVNFHTVGDAERALDTMNYTLILGKPCRIMWSHRDPSRRKVGFGNIFIKNLDKTVNNQQLYDTFSAFGNILSCKVETDDNGVSKGYGYVHFEKEEEAKAAIEKVNGMLIAGKKVFVGTFQSRKERTSDGQEKHYTNVYIKNIDPEITEEGLKTAFEKFGEITSAVIMRDPQGVSRGFGFVNFKEHEKAEKAVAEGNGLTIGTKAVVACRAQKKSDRDRELKHKFEQLKADHPQQSQNVYVRNLDDAFTDDDLRNLFTPFGSITSAKIMADPITKLSKGFGFVSFSTPEEAHKAISEVNGVLVHNKPLYVALAQKKEYRRQQLEAQHNQRLHNNFPPTMAPAYLHQAGPIFYAPGMIPPPQAGQRYPMFPQGGPQGGNVQQGGPAGVVAAGGMMRGTPAGGWRQGPGMPQGGMPHRGGYQQMYNVPGMGIGVRGGRQQGGRRGGLTPQMQMQMMAAAGMKPADVVAAAQQSGWRYKMQARNNNQQQQFPNQTEVPQVQQPPTQVQPTEPTTATETTPAVVAPQAVDPSTYSNLSPEELRQTVGERLFGIIYAIYPQDDQRCGKITGMLLESMDIQDIIKLLDDKEGLAKKIDQANNVYEAHLRKIAEESTAQTTTTTTPATTAPATETK